MEKIKIGFWPQEIVNLIDHLDNAAKGFYEERGSDLEDHVDMLILFLKSELKKHGYEIVGSVYKNRAIKVEVSDERENKNKQGIRRKTSCCNLF